LGDDEIRVYEFFLGAMIIDIKAMPVESPSNGAAVADKQDG